MTGPHTKPTRRRSAETTAPRADDAYRSTSLVDATGLSIDHAEPWAEDFRMIARAVHAEDKPRLRATAPDGWTRHIAVSIPLVEPDRWDSHVLRFLNDLLQTLTGDTWDVSVEPGGVPLDRRGRFAAGWQADEVALYSGGLDSVAYAAARARADSGQVMLVAHDDAGAASAQMAVFKHLAPGRLWLARTRFDDDHPRDGARANTERAQGTRPESSTRSRGLLFLASALLVASAHRVRQVAVPENGQLALNPALTLGRIGTTSTRSVHPYVTAGINRIIAAVGGDVTVVNPWLALTKGEVCAEAVAAGLTPDVLARTVSCGQHTAPREGPNGQCGYCVPCLFRRSGLRAALGSDPTEYHADLWELDTEPRRRHLYDLQRWLARPFTALDLVADMPLPADADPAILTSTVLRGRKELSAMLRDHGHWAGDPAI